MIIEENRCFNNHQSESSKEKECKNDEIFLRFSII